MDWDLVWYKEFWINIILDWFTFMNNGSIYLLERQIKSNIKNLYPIFNLKYRQDWYNKQIFY